MNYQKHVETMFLALIVGLAGFAVNFLGKMSESIDSLNGQMTKVVVRIDADRERVMDIERRVRALESSK